jgi:hypothetical protein
MFGIPIIIFAIASGFALAVGLLFVSLTPSKSEVSKRLEQLEVMRFEPGQRQQAFERIFNEEQRGKLQQQLYEAGWYTVTPAKIGSLLVRSLVLRLECHSPRGVIRRISSTSQVSYSSRLPARICRCRN